jgi:hypothetical protein
MVWNSPFVDKITGHFSPTVPPFPAGVSSVVVDVGAPGDDEEEEGEEDEEKE